MTNLKLISIITPSLNRARWLEGAIQSASAQEYPNYEHIVVDALSADGTRELIEKYPHVRFYSEKDRGMYDALNKGIDLSGGEIICFLNTDDLLGKNVFFDVARSFEDDRTMAVAGRAIVFQESASGQRTIVDEYSPQMRDLLNDSTIGSNYFNAWFFRRSLFDKIGKFNPEYLVAGDRDFMLRLALSGSRYETLDKVTYEYRQHDDSLTFDKDDQKIEWSCVEHVKITDVHLRNAALTGRERKLIIALRTKNTVELAARGLWRLDPTNFFRYSMEGAKYDPAWLLYFFGFGLNRVARLLAKSFVAARRRFNA
jgi:glycosyltransferase involved in cell wall biosynthesis